MPTRLGRPSAPMVVALVALIAAVGGEAIAGEVAKVARHLKNKDLATGAVNSRVVKNGSLRLADFKASDRARLKGDRGDTGPQGPQGAQGAQGPQGATGTVDTANFFTKGESDGRFMQGPGLVLANRRVITIDSSDPNFLALPGFGRIELGCGDPTSSSAGFRNTSGGPLQLWESSDGNAATFQSLANNGIRVAPSAGGVDDPTRIEWEAGSGTGATSKVVSVVVDVFNAPVAAQTECHFQAVATIRG